MTIEIKQISTVEDGFAVFEISINCKYQTQFQHRVSAGDIILIEKAADAMHRLRSRKIKEDYDKI